jgi:hypothetical protein
LHLTFIPYALAHVVLLSREGTLYFKIECSILGSLYNFIFGGDGPIKLHHCPENNKSKAISKLRRHLIESIGQVNYLEHLHRCSVCHSG